MDILSPQRFIIDPKGLRIASDVTEGSMGGLRHDIAQLTGNLDPAFPRHF